MELTPDTKKPDRKTSVRFDTVAEITRSHRLGGKFFQLCFYLGLIDGTENTSPLPGAVKDEDGYMLPSVTSRPVSNRRLMNTANRFLIRSHTHAYRAWEKSGYKSDNPAADDRAFADSIYSHFGSPDYDATTTQGTTEQQYNAGQTNQSGAQTEP